MSWAEAFDKKLDLRNFWQSEAGVNLILSEMNTDVGGTWAIRSEDRDVKIASSRQAKLIAARTVQSLEDGATFWVHPDMMQVVEQASKSFPEHPLQERDMPAPSGFILFGSKWLSRARKKYDHRGHLQPHDRDLFTDGLSWQEAEIITNQGGAVPGMSVSLYLRRENVHLNYPGVSLEELSHIPSVVPIHTAAWGYGVDYVEERRLSVERQLKEGGDSDLWDPEDSNYIDLRRFMHTLFTMLQQRIATTQTKMPPRPARRRMQRDAGGPMPNCEVEVVTLRRPASHSEGGHDTEEVNWSHRWLVDGHWRNQWYPGLKEHKPIWISPHVKGPDNKPLIVKDKVYSLER